MLFPEGLPKPTLFHVTEWMCKRFGVSVAAKAATFPRTREMVGPTPHWMLGS